MLQTASGMPVPRINRALNMALMTDNIAILEEEVELTKKDISQDMERTGQ